jgi:energy-coupling factor transport system ATP-binding protein
MTEANAMKIEMRDICFRYDGGVEALTDISLSLHPGECVALVGHNGSGKSTLVKHLNGLLRPTHGAVLINGDPTSDKRVAQLAGSVALLFQNPNNQICKGSVVEEVAFGPRNLKYPEQKVRELTAAAIAAMDLSGMEDRNPHDLGLSERKRLAIASVMAMDTGAVVLDEPTAGLDPRELGLLEAMLRTLRDQGKIVLAISHDMDFVAENMTRAVCLGQGRKQYDGSVSGLFKNHTLLDQCGLIPPQAVQVGSRLGLTPDILTPEGLVAVLAKARG